jgi:hypothetical protein
MKIDENSRIIVDSLQTFDPNYDFDPLDYSLSIADSIVNDDLDYRIPFIYCRLYEMDFPLYVGNQCILASCIVRRILRLHGIEAHIKQYKIEIKNDNRGWDWRAGWSETVPGGQIATHQVVVTPDLIIDFSQLPFHKRFGASAPKGFIVRRQDGWQNAKNCRVRYTERENHIATKNLIWDQKETEMRWVKHYFNTYSMSH